ncbi:MCE family protein [Mycolicibacterium sp. 018/SC-01/001]|uniref:MCE family protein n=1 Tax=Mycolicibacterium sp. 018/SC-01/001 TaxID=2592069 RepID=UPI00117D3F77|nr:MCE family protein [Mycolicibacterium sp. 018/SC-01/001]TRW80234.1 MCE family protein [Mycolicibacterium sp. 018/SC-01/001]
MLKYSGRRLARFGFMGIALIVLVITVGLQPERLLALATTQRYEAQFTDAGGLTVGNDVTISGSVVGKVTDLKLRDGMVLAQFAVDATVRLGSLTTAHIRTGTLLGDRLLDLESAGDSTLRPLAVIPASRTSSPYSLTDAVGDLTDQVSATNTADVNQSLDLLSSTLDQIAPELGPTFDGLTAVSRLLNERDTNLRALLDDSANVAGILSDRSTKINTLLLNADSLLGVLNDRRYAIVSLLNNTRAVSVQLSGLVADNEAKLAPTLARLNQVNAMLERNRDSVAATIHGLAKYQLAQGDTVAGAGYYNAFVANLIPGQFLQPFLDYAFGFRRGSNAGQPPDNAGPRSELPFPTNGIPGGSR